MTPSERPLHLGILGAFHFPVPQGSQVFVAAQARALGAAGARVALICYGGGEAAPPDLTVERTPSWTTPRSHAAGPRPRKPLADAALLQTLARAHARHRFDALLAHNVEAALVALAARPRLRVPVVYVAHTLVGAELRSYLPGRGWIQRGADRLGRRIDLGLASRADAVIALTDAGARALGPAAGERLHVIPPGLDPRPLPKPSEVQALCRRHGLAPDGYALYAGNLDAYQDLEELRAAARVAGLPVVAVTYATPRALDPIRVITARNECAVRALTAGAAIAVAPRRAAGGFPIKLLNYMEAGRAIVSRAGAAGTLVHGRDAWLVAEAAGPGELAGALALLRHDVALRTRLGAAARGTLTREHAWPALAQRTLALLGDLAIGA